MTYLEWPRRVGALAQFHVANPQRPVLEAKSDHHLRRVLRAREGEEIVVTDGAGTWSLCRVTSSSLERVSDVHRDPVVPETTLYLTPLKGDRAEWAVAKATEVGVSRIVPLVAANTVVKFKGEVRDKTLARWRRVAHESAGQCRRTYDVIVDEPLTPAQVEPSVAVTDFVGDGDWSGLRAVAVGPEGGWTLDEWSDERRRVSLGPTVLRAESAGVVASALLAFQAGEWGFTLGPPRNE